MIFLRRAPTNVSSLSLAANTLSSVIDLLGTRTGTFTLAIRSSVPVYILFDSDTTMDDPATAGFRIGPGGAQQFAVSRATRYMRFYGNDASTATISWYLFPGVPVYETVVKPPVLVKTKAITAGGTTPVAIWNGAGSVDMVCQANTVAYILFGNADMSLATAVTGFPIDSESVVFTITPTQRFMSVGGAAGQLMYYFSGQTDPNV